MGINSEELSTSLVPEISVLFLSNFSTSRAVGLSLGSWSIIFKIEECTFGK